MECEAYEENGRGCNRSNLQTAMPGGVRKSSNLRIGDLRLDFMCTVPDGSHAVELPPPTHDTRQNHENDVSELPIMSNMDEISYWIYTKRAPCLMNYDIIKKQHEEANNSKPHTKSVNSVVQDVPIPKKKKKRKLSLLDNDSVSIEKHQKIYFEVSQKQQINTVITSESENLGSDVDFNIKNTPTRAKAKKSKQKNSRTTLQKKNKIVTSTPKVTTVRRSLRQATRTLSNNNLNDSSFMFSSSIINGNNILHNNGTEVKQKEVIKQDSIQETKKAINDVKAVKKSKINGQFDDLSDVSGLTANYIRSTKEQSSKTPRKLRAKRTRNLVKESNESVQKDELVETNNKTTNNNALINYSSNSSQNGIMVNNKNNSFKANKSNTSLKFTPTKNGNEKKTNLRSTSQSTSRYPKRNKVTDKSKEYIPKTRSRKTAQAENSILVHSNSTEQVSSASVNLASTTNEKQTPKTRRTAKKTAPNRTMCTRKSERIRKDSLRDKSGFNACFSDSDNDSEPLQRKFFCP